MSSNQTSIFDKLLIVSLLVGVFFAVILGVMYSFKDMPDENLRNSFMIYWWPFTYIMIAGFGVSGVAFLIKFVFS